MKHAFAEKYSSLEAWHWWFLGRQQIITTLLARELRGQPHFSIASLGCGPPSGLAWVKPLAGAGGRVVGVDADPIHAQSPGPSVEYIIGQVEAVPLAAHSFDAILLLDVLEHLDDDYLGLREAAGLVKPGGLLLVTVPAGPSLWGGQDVVSHHRRRYTRRALLETFRRAELPRPRLNYFNTLLFPPIAVTRWVRGAIGLAHRSRSDFDDSHPGLMNDILGKVFALERHLIGRLPLPVGVSLIATLRLNAG